MTRGLPCPLQCQKGADFDDAAADALPAAASHFYVTRASVGWVSGPKSAVRPRAVHHVLVNLVAAEPGWWNYVQADMQELLIKQARPRRPPHGSGLQGWERQRLLCHVPEHGDMSRMAVLASYSKLGHSAGCAACRCTLRSGTSLTAQTRRRTTASRSRRTLRRDCLAWLGPMLSLKPGQRHMAVACGVPVLSDCPAWQEQRLESNCPLGCRLSAVMTRQSISWGNLCLK